MPRVRTHCLRDRGVEMAKILGLAGMAALLSACSPAAPELEGNVLRARLNADIISSDPGMKRDDNTAAVILHVVEGVVAARGDGSGGPVPAGTRTVSAAGR